MEQDMDAEMAALVRVGLLCAGGLKAALRPGHTEGPLTFSEWRSEVEAWAARMGHAVRHDELLWLWETVQREPSLILKRGRTFAPHPGERVSVICLPAGAKIGMYLAKSHQVRPEQEARLLEPDGVFVGEGELRLISNGSRGLGLEPLRGSVEIRPERLEAARRTHTQKGKDERLLATGPGKGLRLNVTSLRAYPETPAARYASMQQTN